MARGRGKLTPKDLEYMKTISSNINNLLKTSGTRQVDLSQSTKIPASTLNGYIKGNTLPNPGNIQKIADFFNVSKSAIDPRFEEPNVSSIDKGYNVIQVPLYGSVSCGSGGFVDDNIIDSISIPDIGLNRSIDYFCQYAEGDSMIDAGIDDGDILVFEKSNSIENGQIGCFCIDDNSAICKKFKKGKSFIQLIPMNTAYDPIVINLNDNNFRVIGILKRSIKKF